jgi:hypothetical protein
MPPRTWALLVVTVLALAFVITMEDDEAPVEPPPGPVAIAPAAVAEDAGALPAPRPVPADAALGDGGVVDLGPLVKRAVDAVMAGRHRDALALYEQLAAAEPDNTDYAAMVRLLGKRVEARGE